MAVEVKSKPKPNPTQRVWVQFFMGWVGFGSDNFMSWVWVPHQINIKYLEKVKKLKFQLLDIHNPLGV